MSEEFNKLSNININNINANSHQKSLSSTDEETLGNNNLLKSNSVGDCKIEQQKTEIKRQNFIPKNIYNNDKNSFHNNASINSELSVYNKQSNVYPIYQQMHFPSNIGLTKKAIMAYLNNQQTTIILQKILMESSNETIESIVEELKGEFRNIISDKNGNYFCNDLFKKCGQKERIKILEELSPYLSDDCINHFAAYPIQTLINFSSSEIEYQLILFSFNDYNKLFFASLDSYGNYVIQKIITKIPEHLRKGFNIIFSSFINFISRKKYGIITVKKFLDYTKDKDIISRILILVKNDFISFARDEYGNYLIQFLLEKWANLSEGNEIKKLVLQNFNVMCQQKYSSFICELIIKLLSKEEKINLIRSLDLNEFSNTNNQHVIKIMKSLGIYKEIDNNNNNNFLNQMQLPFNSNYFTNNNYIPMNIYNQVFQNCNNFGNNN